MCIYRLRTGRSKGSRDDVTSFCNQNNRHYKGTHMSRKETDNMCVKVAKSTHKASPPGITRQLERGQNRCSGYQ